MAQKTGGTYYDGNDANLVIDALSEQIENMEKTEFEAKQVSDYQDQFQWFLGIGVFFLLLDIFLFEKKTKWVKKVDLFNEEKTKK